MDALTVAGIGTLVLAGGAYVAPKAKAYLDSRGKNDLPHTSVKLLIDYFTVKKCSRGVKASVDVGKLLYEECTEHVDGEVKPMVPIVNNLP